MAGLRDDTSINSTGKKKEEEQQSHKIPLKFFLLISQRLSHVDDAPTRYCNSANLLGNGRCVRRLHKTGRYMEKDIIITQGAMFVLVGRDAMWRFRTNKNTSQLLRKKKATHNYMVLCFVIHSQPFFSVDIRFDSTRV